MTKELRDLLNQINNKKAEARNLIAQDKLNEAEELKNEITNMQKKYNLMVELAEDDENEIENQISNGKSPANNKKATPINAFLNAFKSIGNKAKITPEEMEILNATTMTEGVPGDGGLTVPQDLRTEIKELRRGTDALENYVNVEPVSTLSGSRVIEKDADSTPFDNIDEAADFPDMLTPEFEDVKYSVKKKGGKLAVTKELFNDTGANIIAYLRKWIAKKSKATRNALIIKQLDTDFGTVKVPIAGLDDLKTIFNTKIDPALTPSSIVVTNQDGYNYLDTLKDADGKYILQPNPADKTQDLLFGKYPIVKLSNKTVKTAANKVPVYCGDLKEAITIFDRESLFIEFSDQAGTLWDKDKIGIKVRERLDVKSVDKKAVVVGEITLADALSIE